MTLIWFLLVPSILNINLSALSDSSGYIFDMQSNTVMAQGGNFENMKEKVSDS